MRKNYNFQLNPRRPSREDIKNHQDFDALLAQYEATRAPAPLRPLRSRRRLAYIGGALAAAVAGLLLYFGVLQSPAGEPVMTAGEYFAQQDYVNPPLENLQPQFTSHKINAATGGAYEISGGSRLVIPSQAFMDDRGRLIEGEIDIRYREMHDYVDFFLAGIPMVYDSAAGHFYLESAGMIEIFALHDGRRVNLAPGKTIDIELVSEITVPAANATPRYNVYHLDTASRQWIYRGIDRIEFLDKDPLLPDDDPLYAAKLELMQKLRVIENEAQTQLTRLENSDPAPPAPVRPQSKSGDRRTLELDLSEAALETTGALYAGTIWQIADRNVDAEALRQTWEDFRLRPVNNLEYELTLLDGDRELRLMVTPVLTGEDYNRALDQYENAQAEYQRLLQARNARLDTRRQEIRENADRLRTEAQTAFELQLNALQQEGITGDPGIRRRVANRFQADSLGVWNCSRLIPLSGESIRAEFFDQYGNEYDHHTAYLTRRGQNTVLQFYSGEGGIIRLNDAAADLLWVVSSDNKIALLRPRQLQQIDPKSGKVRLVLELIDQPIRSEEDVRRILSY